MPATTPRAALVLGWIATLPFAACAAAAWLAPHGWAQAAVVAEIAYGAIALAFLGAVHWGLAIGGYGATDEAAGTSWSRLAGGTVAALVAWLTLTFLSAGLALITLSVALAVMFMVDASAARGGTAPAWYAKLRKPLTIIAIVSLAATLLSPPV